MNLEVIAYARNGFSDKFGIPRQSREESQITTRIVFCPRYSDPNALRGIEDYSHLWLLWGFSEVISQRERNHQSPHGDGTLTVRPPRLGGNVRMGVFATRSPFRPNPIGLSSVRLLRVESVTDEAGNHLMQLVVTGADLLDGTPIYDIKPYLSFSDSHPDARNGFAEQTCDYRLHVECAVNVPSALSQHTWNALQEILSQDPRPAYQSDPERVYRLDYDGWHVAFCVKNDTLTIVELKESESRS